MSSQLRTQRAIVLHDALDNCSHGARPWQAASIGLGSPEKQHRERMDTDTDTDKRRFIMTNGLA